jgi:hypothetical protein
LGSMCLLGAPFRWKIFKNVHEEELFGLFLLPTSLGVISLSFFFFFLPPRVCVLVLLLEKKQLVDKDCKM